MGLFDDFFSSDKTTTSSNTTGPNLPDWLMQALNGNTQTGLSQLQTLAGTTADQRIQGFTPDELEAQQRIRDGTGQYDDIIGGALGSLGQAQTEAMQGIDPSKIQQFMNPYTQNVTDINKRAAVQDADKQRLQLQDQAAAGSGFGGTRAALQNGMLNQNLNQNLEDIENKGNSDAYNSALQAAQTATSQSIAAAQGIGSLASTGESIYNTDSANLAASGEAQRNLAQSKTDFTYTNPYNTTLQAGQLISGASPLYGTTSTGTQTTPGAGWGSQLIGLGTAAAGLMTGNPMLAMGGLSSLSGGGTTSTGATNGMSGFNSTLNQDPYGLFSGAYKNGGVVKMADGGEPMSQSVLQSIDGMSPLEKSVLTAPNDISDQDYYNASIQNDNNGANDSTSQQDQTALGLPSDILPPPRLDGGAQGQAVSTPAYKDGLPDSVFTTTSPKRNMLESVVTKPTDDSLSQIALSALSGDSSSTAAPKSRLQNMLDNANLPLLKTGLAMMASDKPFFQAIGEGGLAGVDQLSKERDAVAKASEKAQDVAIDKQKNQIQQDYNNGRISAMEAKNKVDALLAPSKIAYNTALSGRLKTMGLTLKNQLDSTDKEYFNLSGQLKGTDDDKERAAIQKQMDDNRKQRNELLRAATNDTGSAVNTNIQQEATDAIKKQMSWNDLPD